MGMLNLALAMGLLLLAVSAQAAAYEHDVATAEEFRARDGLPNTFAKLQQGRELRVAYFGGSITAAKGWRPKTLEWFKTQWPTANIVEINAAISGTGSDYGACRLQGDVLAQNPDLVFIEFRVNGGGGFEAQSIEGIVRQILKHNPRTDICFVYTIAHWMLQDLHAGKNTPFGAVMEKVANAYGIPTIDLGPEVIRREKDGSLIFKSAQPVEGKLVFSADGVHPGDAGHDLYRDVIVRSLQKVQGEAEAADHVLPAPLEANRWESAMLLPITDCQKSDGWVTVDTDKDPVYCDNRGRTHAMLRGAVKSAKPGETITLKFSGTTVGMSDIPYAEGSMVEASVDGGAPIVMKRLQTESRKYSRFWYLPQQQPGEHTVTFTVKQVPADGWVYAGQLLVVGTVVR